MQALNYLIASECMLVDPLGKLRRALGLFELPRGCRCLEAVPDVELDCPRPLLKGVHVILQTSSFGTDFRYRPFQFESQLI